MNSRFSQRIGVKDEIVTIQISDMNDELKNSLWNLLHATFSSDRRKTWVSCAHCIHQSVVRGKLVDSTKSGKDRHVDLSPFLVSELRKLKMQTQGQGEWVFQNTAGNRVDMDNFRARTWYPMLKNAELRRVRVHDLRHSYASIVISKTKDIYYAQKQLGHHSITVTVDRYGHLLNEDTETRPVDILDETQVSASNV